MAAEQEPSFTVKLLQLLLLSTYWGMQIWVTFVSSRYLTHLEAQVKGGRGGGVSSKPMKEEKRSL